jgi:predicted amidohydrolase
LNLTALQLPARFGAIEEQLAYAQLLLEGGPRTDLVLMPEAALTGYLTPRGDFDLTRFAEPIDGPTRAAFAHLAKRFDALIVGPVIERTDDGLFNTLLGITPDGSTLIHYRKHHPWFPETWAKPGPLESKVVEWRGNKLTTRICFDVHFLEQDAASELDAADLLLFASAWVDEEDDARPGLLQPLAKAHSVSILNANWGPGSPRIKGQGGSLFLDGQGQLVDRLKTDTGRLDVALP